MPLPPSPLLPQTADTGALDTWYVTHFGPKAHARLRAIPHGLFRDMTAASAAGTLLSDAATAVLQHMHSPEAVDPHELRAWFHCVHTHAMVRLPPHLMQVSKSKYDQLIVLQAICSCIAINGAFTGPSHPRTWDRAAHMAC